MEGIDVLKAPTDRDASWIATVTPRAMEQAYKAPDAVLLRAVSEASDGALMTLPLEAMHRANMKVHPDVIYHCRYGVPADGLALNAVFLAASAVGSSSLAMHASSPRSLDYDVRPHLRRFPKSGLHRHVFIHLFPDTGMAVCHIEFRPKDPDQGERMPGLIDDIMIAMMNSPQSLIDALNEREEHPVDPSDPFLITRHPGSIGSTIVPAADLANVRFTLAVGDSLSQVISSIPPEDKEGREQARRRGCGEFGAGGPTCIPGVNCSYSYGSYDSRCGPPGPIDITITQISSIWWNAIVPPPKPDGEKREKDDLRDG